MTFKIKGKKLGPYSDSCISKKGIGEFVVEYYCKEGKYVSREVILCPGDCVNGACKKKEEITEEFCKPFEDLNNLKETRINVIFIGLGYNDDEPAFKTKLNALFDSKYDNFATIEPFKSNLNRFNFYYITPIKDQSQFISDCYPKAEAYDRIDKLVSLCKIEPNPMAGINIQKIILSDEWLCTHAQLSGGIAWVYYPEMGNDYTRAIIHEFGHSFAGLLDEREPPEGDNFVAPQQGEGVNPQQNCYKGKGTLDDCLANTFWSDLIGNGCGKDGVIDCSEKDQNYELEVGCFDYCDYTSYFRPTKISLMGYISNTPKFGVVNERLLCNKILEPIGSVEGICKTLCLEGCAKGQKCIDQVCKSFS